MLSTRFWLGLMVMVSGSSLLEARADFGSIPGTFLERQEWSVAAKTVGASGLQPFGFLLRTQDGVGPKVADSPFLDAAFYSALPDLYETVYDSQKQKAYDEQVRNLKTVTLYDGFIDMIVSADLPQEMKSAGEQIGQCLAQKISEARDSCVIDEPLKGSKPRAPSTWKLAWARATCGSFVKKCWVRKAFFAAAYPELAKYRDDPKVREMVAKKFEEVFPVRFLQEFKKAIDGYRSNLAAVIAPKIGAKGFALAETPLIQADGPARDSAHSLIRMDGFGWGLLADIQSAKFGLRQGATEVERLLGASGLWAAGNRLIQLTGMDAALFREGSYQWKDSPGPRQPPGLDWAPIGGWSAFWVPLSQGVSSIGRAGGQDQLRFQRWDWEQYYKLPDEPGSVTRIFPHAFEIDANGAPSWSGPESAEYRLDDMVILAEALIEFLDASQKNSVLSKYLGSRDELKEILEPSVPVVLPRQLRMLAYGVLAAIGRNLVHPDINLLEVQDHIEPGMGLGVRFYGKHSFLEPRDGREQASTIAVARLLLVASKLRSLVLSDSELPVPQEKLSALINKVDSLLQIGALTLGADSQVASGGFRAQLGGKDLNQLDLESSILGMRAIQAAYSWSQMPVLRLNLVAGMKWLKAEIVSRNLLFGAWTPQERLMLWEWIALWDDAKPEWRDALPEGGKPQNWAEIRSDLEKRLLDDARSRVDMNR
ncbi:hypothetical protein EBZ37_01145 [bacterium]|nr:hypothetical protein [bacterium]